jgi:diguanylate cyclase (GGDEF)-like protein
MRTMRAMRSAATRERERMLKNDACRDYLTGLLNRRGLEAAVDALDGKDMPLAVYLFDLDNLKHINDTFGHVRGDLTISAFAELLRNQTRESDILSRFGGDEFVVIMKQMKSGKSAVRKGEDICRSIREYPFADKIPAYCSAGVVIWDTREPLPVILEHADQALYRAKAEKKGGCCLWGEGEW